MEPLTAKSHDRLPHCRRFDIAGTNECFRRTRCADASGLRFLLGDIHPDIGYKSAPTGFPAAPVAAEAEAALAYNHTYVHTGAVAAGYI